MSDRESDFGDDADRRSAPRYTTHPKVVAGIVLMASLMLFSVLFTILMMVFGAIAPPAPRSSTLLASPDLEDYFTTQRILYAGGISATLTFLFWVSIPE
jgi:hypothetical protein